MPRYLIAALAAFLIPVTALGQACGDRETFVTHLAKNYGEVPAHLGVTPRGHVVEVLVSPTRSWSLIITHPTGQSCMYATGQAWEDIPRVIEPEGEPS